MCKQQMQFDTPLLSSKEDALSYISLINIVLFPNYSFVSAWWHGLFGALVCITCICTLPLQKINKYAPDCWQEMLESVLCNIMNNIVLHSGDLYNLPDTHVVHRITHKGHEHCIKFHSCDGKLSCSQLTLVMQQEECCVVPLLAPKTDGDLVAQAAQHEAPHQDWLIGEEDGLLSACILHCHLLSL